MLGDPELLAFRRGYYDLLVSLLWREPAGEVVAGLAEGIDGRIEAARHVHPRLAEGWDTLRGLLREVPRDALGETVADEYTRLFLGPRRPTLNPYESFYLTGRLLDRPLVAVRGFLAGVGLERERSYPEPEDHLAFELEIVRRLVARQAEAPDPEAETRWLNAQASFLKAHLLVWGPAVARDLAAAPEARFYRGVGQLLEGFLEVERDLVREWGPGEVVSLEEARRQAGAGDWRGPLFDAEPPAQAPGAGAPPP